MGRAKKWRVSELAYIKYYIPAKSVTFHFFKFLVHVWYEKFGKCRSLFFYENHHFRASSDFCADIVHNDHKNHFKSQTIFAFRWHTSFRKFMSKWTPPWKPWLAEDCKGTQKLSPLRFNRAGTVSIFPRTTKNALSCRKNARFSVWPICCFVTIKFWMKFQKNI